jgi:hypothetical protein
VTVPIRPFRYRPEVLQALLAHGLRPSPATSPALVHDQVNDLYRFELRRLRSRLLAGEIARRDYAAAVVAVRTRYPLLSLRLAFWLE